ncbi:hypothetical protein VPZ60_004243 [Salmonella enterica]|nr:hypothetical protein [Salmonella enterica]
MTFLFSTPARHRLASAVFFAATIGNNLIFTDDIAFYTSGGELSARLIACLVTHLATLVLLGFCAGRLANQGVRQGKFIRMMEHNGFTYYPKTREFKPRGKIRESGNEKTGL